MQWIKQLKPKGERMRRFFTWLAYGIIGGAVAGIVVGLVWVSVEWLIDRRAGNHPTTNWVIMIYEIGATFFGVCGAALGAVVGFFIGVMEAKETRPSS
jgi:hypothetical protein